MTRLMLLDGNGLIYRGYFALMRRPSRRRRASWSTRSSGSRTSSCGASRTSSRTTVAIAFDLAGADLPPRALRRVQGDPPADAGRAARPVPEGARGRRGARASRSTSARASRPTTSSARSPARPRRRGLETTIVTGDLDMLQLVSERTRLMVTRAAACRTPSSTTSPASTSGTACGPTRWSTTRPSRATPRTTSPASPAWARRPPRSWSRSSARSTPSTSGSTRSTPDELRAAARRGAGSRPREPRAQRIVRDVPVALDLDAARLGDYDREAVVRLFREYEFRTLIDRLPPLRARRRSEAAARCGRPATSAGDAAPAPRPRARRPRPRAPAARGRRGRPPALARLRRGGPGRRARRTTGARRAAPARATSRRPSRPLVGRSGAASSAATPTAAGGPRGVARDARRSSAWRSSSTTRGRARGTPLALAVAGEDGRGRRGRGRGGRDRAPGASSRRPARRSSATR